MISTDTTHLPVTDETMFLCNPLSLLGSPFKVDSPRVGVDALACNQAYLSSQEDQVRPQKQQQGPAALHEQECFVSKPSGLLDGVCFLMHLWAAL